MYSNTEKEGTRRRQQVDSMVEGIGINRVTENFEAGRDLIDDAVKVTDEQACRMARWLVENDGIFVGSSSSVNMRGRRGYGHGATGGQQDCYGALRFGHETFE
ncbi:Cysteine synthase 2 [Metarhizium acridum]|nr:Cysteine synthase 2 [Metarhizium acridum]